MLSVSTDHTSLEDLEILELGQAEKRIVITCDADFGELIFKQRVVFKKGIIFFRIDGFRPEESAMMILHQIEQYGTKFENRFSVITRSRVRQSNYDRKA